MAWLVRGTPGTGTGGVRVEKGLEELLTQWGILQQDGVSRSH